MKQITRLACLLLLLGMVTGCSFIKNISNNVDIPTAINAIPRTDEALRQLVIRSAKETYNQQRDLGEDFSLGPCLEEIIITDWSADIAHNPRTEVDDQPENQCQAYRTGQTHHFVELDPQGNLIRAQ